METTVKMTTLQEKAKEAREQKAKLIEQIGATTTIAQMVKVIKSNPKHFEGLAEMAPNFAAMPEMLKEMMLLRLGKNPNKKKAATVRKASRQDLIIAILKERKGQTFELPELATEVHKRYKELNGPEKEPVMADTVFVAKRVCTIMQAFDLAEISADKVTVK